MTALRRAPAAALSSLLGLVLSACMLSNKPPPTPGDKPTRVFPSATHVRDSVYLPVDRGSPAPAGYGLYTVVLTRAANRNAVKLLAELFAGTGSAPEAALSPVNLNLIMIPVKNAAETTRVLASARELPEPTASSVMTKFYDFGQAALLLASVCRPERGAAVMKVCGSTAPDGPILVTGVLPMDPSAAASQRLLVVNIGGASPAAVGEIVAAYRRQVLRRDFGDRAEVDSWRLAVLNVALDASTLLPNISKAYATGK